MPLLPAVLKALTKSGAIKSGWSTAGSMLLRGGASPLIGAGVGGAYGFASSDYDSFNLRAQSGIRGAIAGGAIGLGVGMAGAGLAVNRAVGQRRALALPWKTKSSLRPVQEAASFSSSSVTDDVVMAPFDSPNLTMLRSEVPERGARVFTTGRFSKAATFPSHTNSRSRSFITGRFRKPSVGEEPLGLLRTQAGTPISPGAARFNANVFAQSPLANAAGIAFKGTAGGAVGAGKLAWKGVKGIGGWAQKAWDDPGRLLPGAVMNAPNILGSAARGGAGAVNAAGTAAGFALKHPFMTVGGAGAAYGGYSMLSASGGTDSPTLQGAQVNTNYDAQMAATDFMSRGNYAPTGQVGPAPVMMGPQQRSFRESTDGLVQGLSRGRHG